MKHFKSLVAACLMALPVPALADLADILDSGTVKLAIPESFPPFGALGATGEYEGYDVDVAKLIAEDLGVDLSAYASEMFEAKSDVSAFSDAELLRMDSKEYEVAGTKFRVSVLETTAPKIVLDRKASLMESMGTVASEDGVDQVLLFVVDILNEEATMLIPNELTKTVAEKSFSARVSGDSVVLPGVMSRKKQIIKNLAR